ncbi:MAG: DUF2807 domain-containing protein [Telluria sp.]
MGQLMKWGVAALLGASFGMASAHTDATVTETRPLDARVVRVKLDGQIDLRLRQGPVPSLVISGDKKRLSGTTSEQQGDTLTISNDAKGFKFGRRGTSLRAELTLPQLREVATESVGSADVSGFTGDELDLKLDGAGSMKINCSYRLVTAVLGGVGSMLIEGGKHEGIDLDLRGAGFVTLKGSSKWLKASLGGLGNMDAQHLQVDTVNLELSGLGNASVWVRNNANLNLSGLGSVTVYGKPVNRSVSVDGLGKVSWK